MGLQPSCHYMEKSFPEKLSPRGNSKSPSQMRPLGRAVLEVRKLSLVRGITKILSDVSWRVGRGEHWAIVGPNGCGKTSLLRTLTGYLSATSGDIFLLGQRYGETDWRDLRVHVGLVTSALQTSIPPAEIALETVVSGKYAQLDLWAKPTLNDRRDARRLLRQIGIGALEERPWLFLSQGEKQRVLIARALMAKPKLLILDEPCGGLDPVARADFLEFVEQLAHHRRSPTLVLVTHHIEEIMPAFTHGLLLREGRVVAAGPVRATFTGRNLRETFAHPVKISRAGRSWRLDVPRTARRNKS